MGACFMGFADRDMSDIVISSGRVMYISNFNEYQARVPRAYDGQADDNMADTEDGIRKRAMAVYVSL